MSHPPKLLRSHVRQPDLGCFTFEDRWAVTRRPVRLFELEFPLLHAASPPGSPAALAAMDNPAHGSGAAALTLGDRLALAVAAAASGWVVERFVVDENDKAGRPPWGATTSRRKHPFF
jgi:hypothetical protein